MLACPARTLVISTTGPVSSSRWTCAKGNVAFLLRDSLQSNSNPTAAIAATPHLRMNTDSFCRTRQHVIS
jgi:hypothetical protein